MRFYEGDAEGWGGWWAIEDGDKTIQSEPQRTIEFNEKTISNIRNVKCNRLHPSIPDG